MPDEPVADFGLSPAEPTSVDEVRLYDFSFDPAGIGIASRRWDFGDGAASETSPSRHRFERPGVYQVTLAVRTFDGRRSSVVRKLHIRSPRHAGGNDRVV